MLALTFDRAVDDQDDRMDYDGEILGDDEVAFDAGYDAEVWDDEGLMEAARGDTEERNLILGQLMEMTLSSAGGYQEVLELAYDPRTQAFAAVMIRQRMAQHHALSDRQTQRWGVETGQSREMLTAIRSAWRLAIWNLEQHRLPEFLDQAERAESLLEDAFLASAAAFDDRDWRDPLQESAVTICGARERWEDFSDEVHSQPEDEDAERGMFELAIA